MSINDQGWVAFTDRKGAETRHYFRKGFALACCGRIHDESPRVDHVHEHPSNCSLCAKKRLKLLAPGGLTRPAATSVRRGARLRAAPNS